LAYPQIERLKEQYRSEEKWYSLRWHYIESCILKAYMDSYKRTGDEADYRFVKLFIDRLYDQSGMIPGIRLDYYSIDQIRMASVLLSLYEVDPDPKYKRVADQLYGQLAFYPRTDSGNFWHKQDYPHQVWLDGLYMGQPFYVEYVKQFIGTRDYSDTIAQFANISRHLYNRENRLFYHAYDESRSIFWADKETGRSPQVWARAVGWLAMALVDVLELLAGEPADTGPLQEQLLEVIEGMLPYQHSSGMWYQVVDRGASPGNYLEASGTLMLAFAILKGVRLSLLPSHWAVRGQAAFDGTASHYLREEQGEVLLGGICKGAGLGRNPDSGIVRDGSYEYYVYNEKVADNNGHGVAALLLAYNEICRALLPDAR
jgi:unsaturated rhamnogalacturonyl hydrolase